MARPAWNDGRFLYAMASGCRRDRRLVLGFRRLPGRAAGRRPRLEQPVQLDVEARVTMNCKTCGNLPKPGDDHGDIPEGHRVEKPAVVPGGAEPYQTDQQE